MFGSDAARSRFNPQTSGTSIQSASALSAVWNASIGTSINSSPAVVAGVAYFGAADGRLRAFTNGSNCSWGVACTPIWTATTGGAVESSPTVNNGVVYVGSNDGRLYAFDAAGQTNCAGTPVTCNPLWSALTGGPVRSSPAVANGVVYVGSDDDRLYAFDAAGNTNCTGGTCLPLWTGATGAAVTSSPAVANGVVYVGSKDGKLYAFDAAGKTNCAAAACLPLWTGTTSGPVESSPAVIGGVVYVGSDDGRLYAYDAAAKTNCTTILTTTTCLPIWNATTGGPVKSSPAVANGVVYVGSDDSHLYAFDAAGKTECTAASCLPLWTSQTGAAITGSPAVANGVVYIGSGDGQLYAYDAGGTVECSGSPTVCAPLWAQGTGGPITASPAVANGLLYAGSTSGWFGAYRAVIYPISSTLSANVLTSEASDTYSVVSSGSSVTSSAPSSNGGSSTRILFTRPADATGTDEQSCATWSSQSADIDQEGAALRVTRNNATVKAITVTKNVWFAPWIFNVHVWDTSTSAVATQIASFDLRSTFDPNSTFVPLPLPWAMCARVVGSTVSFIVWPTNQPQPAWNDPAYGGSVTLPSGYGAAGSAGWYVGHLRAGDTATYTNLAAGPLGTTASPSFHVTPVNPPRAPHPIPGLLP